jgi:hypothetical protein
LIRAVEAQLVTDHANHADAYCMLEQCHLKLELGQLPGLVRTKVGYDMLLHSSHVFLRDPHRNG